MSFDLKPYLALFPEICRKKFGRSYDFAGMERQFSHLRDEKRWLTATHIVKLFDKERTPFRLYWPPPKEKELDELLKRQRVHLAPPHDERELVQRLLKVFQNIGIASLVLRFCYPERFGVFSTPVVNLLLVHQGKTVELYLSYCDELEAWRAHFRLETVAATEMALWAFHESGTGQKEFAADVWIQRRRVAQVLRPFLKNYGALQLAEILVEEDANLAAIIAGREYERLLRAAARQFELNLSEDRGWAKQVLKDLEGRQVISWAQREELDGIWSVRNAAVHAAGDVKAEQVENMIRLLRSHCAAWDKPQRVKKSAKA